MRGIIGNQDDKSWFLVPALLPPDDVEIELVHMNSLWLLGDTFIKPDGAYLLFWTEDSRRVKKLVTAGLQLISGEISLD